MIRITNNSDCCGCEACKQICPKNSISMRRDAEGFLYPTVDMSSCIGCHLCEKNSGGKEAGHFTFQGFLAKVNYANPPDDEQIVAKCPAKCMSVDPHFESGH